ncbi:TIGR03790 family protein [Nitrospira sp. M1]
MVLRDNQRQKLEYHRVGGYRIRVQHVRKPLVVKIFTVFQWVGLLTFMAMSVLQEPVWAALSPTQVVIVSNMNSRESDSVARYYAQQRGIPLSHIIELDTSTRETIGREEYKESIAQPLREALQVKKLAPTVRVIVTTYGIPLRVEAPRPSAQETVWLEDAKAWRKSSVEFLQELTHDIEGIATQKPEAAFSPSHDVDMNERAIHVFLQEVGQAIQRANDRIRNIEDVDRRKAHERVLEKIIQRINGMAGTVQILRSVSEKTAMAMDAPLTALHGQLRSAERLTSLLLTVPSDNNREHAYQVVQQHFGVAGVLRFANQEIQRFSFVHARASVDSELSVVWWGHTFAHPSGKIPNPLYAWYPEQAQEQALSLPVMLVSRLDGPNPDLVKRMIDHATLTEQNGLRGNAYFDARGMDSKQLLSYGHYDRDIRMLSEAVRNISSYPVVLENTQKRLSEPGDAPHVALYVGWYRLRHYEDAFTFNPGAIGYHIASGEAVSLRDPIERGWCKNALERGITVTLGPIGEPYLDAFPLPTEFFGLLLTGRYSVVEAFYLSSRHLSWQMVLVGDPLYNPWRGRAFAQKVKKSGILRRQTFPVPPSERVFSDPLHIREKLLEERRQVLSRLSLREGR